MSLSTRLSASRTELFGIQCVINAPELHQQAWRHDSPSYYHVCSYWYFSGRWHRELLSYDGTPKEWFHPFVSIFSAFLEYIRTYKDIQRIPLFVDLTLWYDINEIWKGQPYTTSNINSHSSNLQVTTGDLTTRVTTKPGIYIIYNIKTNLKMLSHDHSVVSITNY